MSVIRQEYKLGWIHWNIGDYLLLSGILAFLGQPKKAARIRSACHKLRSELGLDDFPYDQSIMENAMADIKAQLDESAFAEAWDAGQCMTCEQLQAYV